MDRIERKAYKPSVIVMTSEQRDDCIKSENRLRFSIGVPDVEKGETLFGLPIEIAEWPKWCVGVEEEW